MDRTTNCYKRSEISQWLRSWSQLRILPTVLANSDVQISDTNAVNENNSEALDEAPNRVIAENSDENFKRIMADPAFMAEIERDVKEHMSKETGWDRLVRMYIGEKSDEFSQDMNLAVGAATNAGCLTFLACSAFGGNAAAMRFKEKNQHTAFDTKFIALRRFNDVYFFGCIRFGLKMACKVGLFTGIFMLASQSISAYRNKSSLWEYIAGGSMTCSLLRIGHGWRGVVAGGILGSGFGLFGGIVILCSMKLAGWTREERYHQELMKYYSAKKEFTSQAPGVLLLEPKVQDAVAA